MKRIKKFIPHVDCPIFLEYEERIKKLSQSFNTHRISSKKVDKAQELLDIIDILSNCPRYNEESEDCESCRFLLNLRREIGRIVIEAAEIAY